jgi:hypothetical protein
MPVVREKATAVSVNRIEKNAAPAVGKDTNIQIDALTVS